MDAIPIFGVDHLFPQFERRLKVSRNVQNAVELRRPVHIIRYEIPIPGSDCRGRLAVLATFLKFSLGPLTFGDVPCLGNDHDDFAILVLQRMKRKIDTYVSTKRLEEVGLVADELTFRRTPDSFSQGLRGAKCRGKPGSLPERAADNVRLRHPRKIR